MCGVLVVRGGGGGGDLERGCDEEIFSENRHLAIRFSLYKTVCATRTNVPGG